MTDNTERVPYEIQVLADEIFSKIKIRTAGSDIIKAACLYAAFKIKSQPRTLEEISYLCKCPQKEVGRAYKNLHLKIPPSKPEEYIDRFCYDLGYKDQKVAECAKQILNLARHCDDFCCVCNKTPSNIASAAIYISGYLCKDRRTQLEMEICCNTKHPTLRRYYKEICEKAEIEMDMLSEIQNMRGIHDH